VTAKVPLWQWQNACRIKCGNRWQGPFFGGIQLHSTTTQKGGVNQSAKKTDLEGFMTIVYYSTVSWFVGSMVIIPYQLYPTSCSFKVSFFDHYYSQVNKQ